MEKGYKIPNDEEDYNLTDYYKSSVSRCRQGIADRIRSGNRVPLKCYIYSKSKASWYKIQVCMKIENNQASPINEAPPTYEEAINDIISPSNNIRSNIASNVVSFPNNLETEIIRNKSLVQSEQMENNWNPSGEENRYVLSAFFGGSVNRAKHDIAKRIKDGDPVP